MTQRTHPAIRQVVVAAQGCRFRGQSFTRTTEMTFHLTNRFHHTLEMIQIINIDDEIE